MNLFTKQSEVETHILLPCVHAPFHNKKLFDSFFKYAKDIKNIKSLCILGDFLDMNSLSAHDKGKIPIEGIELGKEYREATRLLDTILSVLPKGIDKHYLYGNHEDRYFRYIKGVDESKLGGALESPDKALGLKSKGFTVYTDWKNDEILFGTHLIGVHGEFCNVHTAKKTIDTYRKSVIYAHTHRFQVYVEGRTGGFNIGSMADFNSPVFKYATKAMRSSWLNGFALVHIDKKSGLYYVQPIMAFDGTFCVNGKKY